MAEEKKEQQEQAAEAVAIEPSEFDKLLKKEFKISHTVLQYECECVRRTECKEDC